MTSAEKEARLDSAVETIVRMLSGAQSRGVQADKIDAVHNSAAALLWFKGRGRSAALGAARAILTTRHATLGK